MDPDTLADLIAANAAQRILFDGCAPELLAPPANAYRLALQEASDITLRFASSALPGAARTSRG